MLGVLLTHYIEVIKSKFSDVGNLYKLQQMETYMGPKTGSKKTRDWTAMTISQLEFGSLLSDTMSQREHGNLRSDTTMSQREYGSLLSDTTMSQREYGSLLSDTTMSQREHGNLRSDTTMSQREYGSLRSDTTMPQQVCGSLRSDTTMSQREYGSLRSDTTMPQQLCGSLRSDTVIKNAVKIKHRQYASHESDSSDDSNNLSRSNRTINTDPQDVKKRVVYHNGKSYEKTMYWHAGNLNLKLTKTSNAEKKVLRELLGKMKRNSPPDSYRKKATWEQSYTIVNGEGDKKNYRIDNQMKLNLKDRDPRLNIQYQIGKKSYAMVLVGMKPTECPRDLIDQVGLIDEDDIFSFNPNVVMSLIENALQYSADNRCNTYIKWTITEIKQGGSCNTFGKTKSAVLTTAKIGAKTMAEQVTKLVFKEGTTLVWKNGTTVVWKKVPVVGLGCAAVCSVLRLLDGDKLGAALELVSGAASCAIGLGTTASYFIDASLFLYDMIRL